MSRLERLEIMYSAFSKKDRLRIRITLSSSWAFVFVGSLGGLFLSPTTVVDEIGWLHTYGSILALSFSLVAFLGVVFNRYWLEWISAWFTAAGLAVYVSGIWWILAGGNTTRLQQAGYTTALLCFTIYRGVANAAHARKLRDVHRMVIEIQERDSR